mmetsp:Transcript_34444/g.63522  ORF Transcript_34444/g.63522 Transcript_34444/m.63522 type:complete len:178 (+) Transcript_34444:62-595(+)
MVGNSLGDSLGDWEDDAMLGPPDGSNEGPGDRSKEGLGDGRGDGLGVGFGDGLRVGFGFGDGLGDGFGDGRGDGLNDGLKDGFGDGLGDGRSDGLNVGLSVIGLPLGVCDGPFVSADIGAFVTVDEGLGLSDGLCNPKLQSIVFSPSFNSKQIVFPLSESIVLSKLTSFITLSSGLK